MGAVCSAGMVEGNAELGGKKTFGFSGKLKKEDSSVNRRTETFSDSRSNVQGKKQKKQVTDFSDEFKLSSPTPTGAKQVCFNLLIFVCGDGMWFSTIVLGM